MKSVHFRLQLNKVARLDWQDYTVLIVSTTSQHSVATANANQCYIPRQSYFSLITLLSMPWSALTDAATVSRWNGRHLDAPGWRDRAPGPVGSWSPPGRPSWAEAGWGWRLWSGCCPSRRCTGCRWGPQPVRRAPWGGRRGRSRHHLWKQEALEKHNAQTRTRFRGEGGKMKILRRLWAFLSLWLRIQDPLGPDGPPVTRGFAPSDTLIVTSASSYAASGLLKGFRWVCAAQQANRWMPPF